MRIIAHLPVLLLLGACAGGYTLIQPENGRYKAVIFDESLTRGGLFVESGIPAGVPFRMDRVGADGVPAYCGPRIVNGQPSGNDFCFPARVPDDKMFKIKHHFVWVDMDGHVTPREPGAN